MTMKPAPAQRVRPGELILDQFGEVAQLHGVGILQLGSEFFAWGEDKSEGAAYAGINCYSSHDLSRWVFRGVALGRASEGDLGPGRVIERPKVLHDPTRGRYVMMVHVDSADYSDARVGFAVSDSAAGPYTYLRSERPLGNLSRDIGVFTDDDGTGYLLSEDRDNGLHIYRLASDLLSVIELISTTRTARDDHGYESPALIKSDGLYYLFGSDLTGWSTNDNKVATARDLRGPWSPWSDIAPPGSSTFDSQISAVLQVRGSHRTTYIYLGDRWRREDLGNSPPVWLPVDLDSGRATIRWRDDWSLDTATGVIG